MSLVAEPKAGGGNLRLLVRFYDARVAFLPGDPDTGAPEAVGAAGI